MNQQLAARKALGRRLRVGGARALAAGTAAAPDPADAAPGAGAASKPKFRPLAVLKGLDTSSLLTGKDLNQAARALTALEIRPQVHGYKQLAKQLTRERNEETAGLGKLGSELQGNVGSVYGGIAKADAQGNAAQQAIGSMLTSQAGQIAQQGQAALTGMQSGQLGDFTKALAMRGAPAGGGGAQQALSDAVAQQQAAQVANSGAAQQFAAQQASSNAALSQQMAAATQMQGGAAVGGIGRDIVQRVGASNQKYRESIQQALGKLADVKATKGATFNKNLLSLRGEEQKYQLGKAAVQGDKAALAETQRHNEAAEATSAKSANASMISALASQWNAHHPGASDNEKAEHRKEVRQEANGLRSMLPGLVTTAGGAPKDKQQLNAFIQYANEKSSADPQVVSRVIKEWWLDRRTGKKQGGVHR